MANTGNARLGVTIDTAALTQSLSQIEQAVNQSIARINAKGGVQGTPLPQGSLAGLASSAPATPLNPQQTAAFAETLGLAIQRATAIASGVAGGNTGAFGNLYRGQFQGNPFASATGGLTSGSLSEFFKREFGVSGVSGNTGLAGLNALLGSNPLANFAAAQAAALGNTQTRGKTSSVLSPISRQAVKDEAEARVESRRLAAAVEQEIFQRQELRRAYLQSTIQERRLSTVMESLIQQRLASNQQYIRAQVRLARSAAVEEAAVQTRLATDQQYLSAKVSTAVAQEQEAATVAGRLAGDQAYIKAKADATIAQQAETIAIKRRLAVGSDASLSNQQRAQITALEKQQQASIQRILVGNQEYLDAKISSAAVSAQEEAIVRRGLLANNRYIEAKAETAIASQQEKLAIQRQIALTGGQRANANAQAELAVLAQQEKTLVAQTLAGDQAYIQAKAAATVARQQEAAAISAAIVNDPILAIRSVQSSVAGQVADQQRKTAEAAALAGNAGFAQAKGEEAADRERIRTQENVARLRSIDGDEALAQQKRQEVALKQKIQARELAAFTTLDAQRKAAISIEQRRISTETKLAEQRLLATQQGVAIRQAEAERIVLERNYNRQLRRDIAAQYAAQGRPLAAFTSRFGGTSAGEGAVGGGPGNFFGGGLLSTLKYSIPSLLLFGAASGIAGAVKEAEELNKTLSLLEAQLDSVGRSGDFEGLRSEILGISRDTGLAADQVAKFAVQLQGAFGRETIQNVSGQDLVERQLQGVARLDRLLELNDKEVIDTTIAVGRAYDVFADQIGNVAFQLQNELGVAAEETQVFLANIAPVAKEAGFELNEIAALGGTAIANSGRSAAELAEAFGRIIPQLAKNKEDLIELSLSDSLLNTDQFRQAIASGNELEIFRQIGTNFENLNGQTKDFVVNLLGGRREANALLAAFSDFETVDRLINEIDPADAEAQTKAWERLQQTLGQAAAELGQALTQLGVALLDSGIGDALRLMLESFGGIAKLVTTILTAVTDLNATLGGMPLILGTIAAAWRVVAVSAAAANTGAAAGAVGAAGAGGATASGLILPPGVVGGVGAGAGAAGGAAFGRFGRGLNTATGGRFATFANSGIGQGISVGLATLGLGQAVSTYQANDAELAAAADSLRERFKDVAQEELEAIASESNSFFQELAGTIFGEDLPNELAQTELDRREGAESVDTVSALESSDLLDKFLDKYLKNSSVLNDVSTRLSEDDKALQELYEAVTGGNAGDFSLEEAVGTFDTPEDISQFLQDNLTEEGIKRLKEKSDEGDEAAVDALNFLINAGLVNAELNEIAGEAAQNQVEIGVKLDQALLTLDAAKASFQAGKGSGTQVLKLYDQSINEYRRAIADAKSEGEATTELEIALSQLEKERADEAANLFRARAEAFLAVQNIGADPLTAAKNELAAVVQQLDRAVADGADTNTISELTNQAIAAQRAVIDAQLNDFETAAERLAYLNSNAVVIDSALMVQLIVGQLNEANLWWGRILDSVEDFYGSAAEEFLRNVVSSGALGDKSASRVIADLEGTAAVLENVQGNTEAADLFRDRADTIARLIEQGVSDQEAIAQAFGVAIPSDSLVSQAEIAQQERDAAREAEEARREAERAAEEAKREQEEARQKAIALQNARFEYYKILAGGDAVRAAQVSIDQANFALANATNPVEYQQAINQQAQAERERLEAQRDIIAARSEYDRSLVADDPVAVARIEQQESRRAVAEAEGEAERLRALAAQVSADRAFVNAVRSVYDAQSSYVIALAEVSGEAVAGSEASLALARRQYAEAEDDYNAGRIGSAEFLSVAENLVRAQGSNRDAILQDRLDELSYLFEFERISKSQYVEYLESLKQIPDLTEKQKRDIDRQIRQLTQELKQDFQFNLPTNLNLPTVYEVRRLQQGQGVGGQIGQGYQDNRQVQININVQDSNDRAFVEQVISDAVATPTVSSGRLY